MLQMISNHFSEKTTFANKANEFHPEIVRKEEHFVIQRTCKPSHIFDNRLNALIVKSWSFFSKK